MLTAVIILITISTVCCKTNCSEFNGFTHDAKLLPQVTGTYFVKYTSIDKPFNWERSNWINVNGVITGVVEVPDCCIKINVLDTSGWNQIPYTADLLWGQCGWTSTITITAEMKLIATLGEGDQLCMVCALCADSRAGIMVSCRQPNPTTLIGAIFSLLVNLVGSLLAFLEILALAPVSQINCCYAANNCALVYERL